MSTDLIVPSAMTEREFGTVFAKLAIQLRWTDADEVAVRSYFDALKSLPLDAIQTSAQTFAQEPGRKFFPTSGEWFERGRKALTDALRETLSARDNPWVCECEACDDTGWMRHECDGSRLCGRGKAHAAHSYVTVCPCRPINRTYQRHQKFGVS